LSPPQANVSLNGWRLVSLGTPVNLSDAATLGYVTSAVAAGVSSVTWPISGTPPFRGLFQLNLPLITDTSAQVQTEAMAYNKYYFYGVSGWRKVWSVPFRNWQTAPAHSTSTGTFGQVAYDNNYFYVCTANNTWMRIVLATWSGTVPFVATSSVQPGYEYCDETAFYYVAVANNTWLRFPISTFSGFANSYPSITAYYPGMPGMETVDPAGFWYVCVSPNNWLRATLLTASF